MEINSVNSTANRLCYCVLFLGLFHGAIAQSGSALNLWAKPLNAIQATAARSQGRVAGCVELLDSYKLIECLRKVDAQKLLDSGDSFKVRLF